jgi:metal-responsive CopG/Arc/MetJ family transcriptional regulator
MRKKVDRRGINSPKTVLVRASISFPPAIYETLGSIARQKKVSLAWVVRDATERYVAEQTTQGKKGRGRSSKVVGD